MSELPGAVFFIFLLEAHANIQPIGEASIDYTHIYIVKIGVAVVSAQSEFFGDVDLPVFVQINAESLRLPVFEVSIPLDGERRSAEKAREKYRHCKTGCRS